VTFALSITTLMGCLWLALSVAAIALGKRWTRLMGPSGSLSRRLDLSARPIRALGIMAGMLFAVAPLAYYLI
jgi:hypothetical protein